MEESNEFSYPGLYEVVFMKAEKFINTVLNWGRSNSLWPLTFGTSCCAIEMMTFGATKVDADRLGVLFNGDSPRQSDLILVSGTITKKMARRLLNVYEQIPDPKYVIAVGACNVSGGLYHDSYNTIEGIDRIMPVDAFIPGCPPRPEEFLDAVRVLQKLIKENRSKAQENGRS
ncbi:MAG: NADH-quinone oxidoreductase, B subunit [Candidatus Parvarchaeum acidiphilum ARMAN-4]|uniref:NADH-quinone oxidoreductase, B subunit n=1 Tax=Candidatus Parvarchaeum acidiphilum ARMAN-4 TaxID=662760 RepID=D2EGC1_PARA4|nr:MAG: NADH-quinone oxidoreductase, B subunit [Candidatus Parvarchaeum acidiphilum ARMAN-4]